jgi:hypothetical protein
MFIEEVLNTEDNYVQPRHSLLLEILKGPFYLTLPFQSNFVFKKKKFCILVLTLCQMICYFSFGNISLQPVIVMAAISVVYHLVYYCFQMRWIKKFSDFLAISACVVLIFNFIDALRSVFGFAMSSLGAKEQFAIVIALAPIDWTLRTLISHHLYNGQIQPKRVGFLRADRINGLADFV